MDVLVLVRPGAEPSVLGSLVWTFECDHIDRDWRKQVGLKLCTNLTQLVEVRGEIQRSRNLDSGLVQVLIHLVTLDCYTEPLAPRGCSGHLFIEQEAIN